MVNLKMEEKRQYAPVNQSDKWPESELIFGELPDVSE